MIDNGDTLIPGVNVIRLKIIARYRIAAPF